MKFTGAQLITTLLERQGIDIVAGIPGGANLPMYDAVHDSRIRHVLARHEQGAGFIAQGMARATGRPAVCFGTSGPGATNLLTAIADAKLDSIPLVSITGQVPRAMIGTDAFQEIDTYGLTIPITKHNYLVRAAAELLDVIPDAFRVAMSGRPGPVVVDVPKDVQTETVELAALPDPGEADPPPRLQAGDIAGAAALINAARRPLLLIGAGIITANAGGELRRLAETASIPVAATLLGLGAMPATHPLFLGMVGMHAARFTNLLLEECDLLIALGIRFDDRATGKAAAFCPEAKILHVDIDASELGKIKQPFLGIEADVGETLRALQPLVAAVPRTEWMQHITRRRAADPLAMPGADDPLAPYGIVRHVAALVGDQAIVTSDVGQHQMWVAQAFPFARPRQWLTSGGLGTMGFGLPAAIGAALAEPARTVVCFTGDGSLLMNLQELATAAEAAVNVKVILLNNGHLGLVRQQQHLFYGARYSASRFHAAPDFAALARAFGIAAYDLGDATDPVAALGRSLGEPGPCLINVPIAAEANVYPMVPPGAANRDMLDLPLTPSLPRRGGGCFDRTGVTMQSTVPESSTRSVRSSAVLRLLVRNHPGVMSHVCGLFARRAFNVEGILCLPVGDGTCSVILLDVFEGKTSSCLRQLCEGSLQRPTGAVHRKDAGRSPLVVNEEARLEQLIRQLRKLEDVLEVHRAPEARDAFAEITKWIQ